MTVSKPAGSSDGEPNERVNYRWVVASGLIGLLFGGVAFVGQFAFGWSGAPVEALISVGTAIGLVAVVYFLQRRIIVEARQVATRAAETVAETVADSRVAERVQEVTSRLDELGKRMDELAVERAQRQDSAVQAMDNPTFESVATALAEANRLRAIADGKVSSGQSRPR